LALAHILKELMASTVPAMPSAGTWQTRCDLAACYRLTDLFG
jgi:hypothetical protein